MIIFSRTANIAPGKPAITWSREVAAYMKQKTGVQMRITMPVSGNPWRICFLGEFENLTAVDALQAKLRGDPKYRELLAKGSDYFIAGSITDEFWRTV
jgi:hypothetical protein